MDNVTTLPRTDGFTRADLEAMPDDRRRYELLDGVIVVTPSPSYRHQGIVGNLHLALRAGCPDGMRVRLAPFDVALSDRTVMEPDLLVADVSDFSAKDLPTAPLLAIEVLSPSTRRFDLHVKRDLLEEAGCSSYWVIDPGTQHTQPSLTAWELTDGAYVEVARVSGDETWHATRPFAVDLTPNLLLDD